MSPFGARLLLDRWRIRPAGSSLRPSEGAVPITCAHHAPWHALPALAYGSASRLSGQRHGGDHHDLWGGPTPWLAEGKFGPLRDPVSSIAQCELGFPGSANLAYRERLESLRVFGRLPDTGVSKRTEAGVRKASREETAGGVRTDAGVDLWGIYRRCWI
jgi:hypothetical protein